MSSSQSHAQKETRQRNAPGVTFTSRHHDVPSLPSTFDLARPVVTSPSSHPVLASSSSHPVHASSSSHPVHRPQSSTASVTPYDYEYHMQELAPGEARGPWMPAMSHISGASSSVWSALVPVTTADTATTDAAIAVHVARMAATIASPNGREPSASASTRVSTESIIRRDRETLSCPPPMPPPMASSSSVDLHRSTPTSAENHGCLSLPKRRRYDVPVADDLQGGSNDEDISTRERNRRAALQCRMRKKHWVGALQERFDALSKDNERLRVEERALAAEVALMRGLLEEWRGCAVVARESM